ncbi:MAG: TSUP family transporter, partial [Bdellovibrionota bacterium]
MHDLFLVFLAFFSEAIGTISGFGSSTFFVPIAVFFEAFSFVLALTAILHCFGNFSKIFLFQEHLPKSLLLKLGLPSVLLAGVGALLSAHAPVSILSQLLGFLLTAVALLTLFKKRRPSNISNAQASAICGFSGLMTGLVGTGGALRGMALAALQIEKNSFVALSAAIDLGGDLLRAVIYLWQGFMDWNQWLYIPALG